MDALYQVLCRGSTLHTQRTRGWGPPLLETLAPSLLERVAMAVGEAKDEVATVVLNLSFFPVMPSSSQKPD